MSLSLRAICKLRDDGVQSVPCIVLEVHCHQRFPDSRLTEATVSARRMEQASVTVVLCDFAIGELYCLPMNWVTVEPEQIYAIDPKQHWER